MDKLAAMCEEMCVVVGVYPERGTASDLKYGQCLPYASEPSEDHTDFLDLAGCMEEVAALGLLEIE